MATTKIKRERVELIKESLRIEEVIGREIQLKKGENLYYAICPFHKERTGSFHIVPDKQFYYCFGCGAGGDMVQFLIDHHDISFVKAMRMLSNQSGIPLK